MRRGVKWQPPPRIGTTQVPREVHGYPVYLDPDLPGFAEARGLWPLKWICISPAWFVLHHGQQIAVLLHEVWHCKAFHLERRLLMLPFMGAKWWIERCKKMELDADEFAANHGYGLELLYFMRRHDLQQGAYYPTAAERIAALERYLMGESNEVVA